MQTIVSDLLQKGITDIKPLLLDSENNCLAPSGWNWATQDNWPCDCGTGVV